MADREAAHAPLDANGVAHGDLLRPEPFGIAVRALRDPDNNQVELTAPLG